MNVGSPVATPQVPVQERCDRLSAGEERGQTFQQPRAALLQWAGVAFGAGQVQLMPQTALAPEPDPIPVPGIRLWRATDGVVAMPTVGVGRCAMLQRQSLPEGGLRAGRGNAVFNPLQRQPTRRRLCANTQDAWDADCFRTRQFAQTVRFGFQHVAAAGAGDFDEYRALGAVPAVAFVDASAVDTRGRLWIQLPADGATYGLGRGPMQV